MFLCFCVFVFLCFCVFMFFVFVFLCFYVFCFCVFVFLCLCFCVFVFLCFCVFVFLCFYVFCFCVFVFLCFCVFCFCVFVFLCLLTMELEQQQISTCSQHGKKGFVFLLFITSSDMIEQNSNKTLHLNLCFGYLRKEILILFCEFHFKKKEKKK